MAKCKYIYLSTNSRHLNFSIYMLCILTPPIHCIPETKYCYYTYKFSHQLLLRLQFFTFFSLSKTMQMFVHELPACYCKMYLTTSFIIRSSLLPDTECYQLKIAAVAESKTWLLPLFYWSKSRLNTLRSLSFEQPV